jgi:hypothetical protein
MFANLNKKIELAANATIILVAALLCVVLAKNHLLSAPVANTKADVSQTRQAPNQLPIGTHLSYLDVDWKQSPQTLVLAISSVCHFCTESGSFYKTVMQNRKNTRVIAVLPQPVEEGKAICRSWEYRLMKCGSCPWTKSALTAHQLYCLWLIPA